MLLDRQFPYHSPPLSWLLSECENEKGRRRRRKKLCCNSIRYNLISLGCLQYIETWNPCCCWGGGALESHRARRGSIRLSRFIFWHDIQVLCVHLNIFIGVLLGQKKKNTTKNEDIFSHVSYHSLSLFSGLYQGTRVEQWHTAIMFRTIFKPVLLFYLSTFSGITPQTLDRSRSRCSRAYILRHCRPCIDVLFCTPSHITFLVFFYLVSFVCTEVEK